MIVRHFGPRQCRRALCAHAARPRPTQRTFATEIEQNEARFADHLREAAAMPPASTNTDTSRPRRRRKEPPRDPMVESYLAFQHMKSTTAQYGTNVSDYHQPHTLLANPPRPADVTLELLLASQAHLGHSTSLWNPANSRYIFGIREGIHIISLDVTAAHLRRAAKVVSGVAQRGGLILFVGNRPGFDSCVVRAAQLSGACHLFEKWTPGSITNAQQILGKCRMKVVDENDSEIEGFDEQLFDRSALKPDLVVVLNPLENRVLLAECAMSNIPTIGIIDTDANPTWVTYPIPANDDSIRCVQVIAGVLGRAGQEGRQLRFESAKQGKITFLPTEGLILPNDWEEQQQSIEAEKEENPIRYGTATHTGHNLPIGDVTEQSEAQKVDELTQANNYKPQLKSIAAKLNQAELMTLQQGTMTQETFDALQQRLSPEETQLLLDSMSGAHVDTAPSRMGQNPPEVEEDSRNSASPFYDQNPDDEDLENTSSHVRR